MKITKKTSSFLVALLFFSSCVELEQVNPNTASESSFWKTENDLFQGVIATYDAMQLSGLYLGNLQVILTGFSDEGTGESTNEFYAPFRFKIFNSNIFLSEMMWIHFYAMISRGYQVIDNADTISGDNVPAILAEAKTLVAFAYYNMINVYGENIAYVDRTQKASDIPNRAEDGQIYTLIENLLTEAIPDLPLASDYNDSDYGRISKGAAQAILAKVYLHQQKYDMAEPLLESIVNSSQYQLLPSYEDNFTEKNIINPEAVFHINFLHDGPAFESNRSVRHQGFSPREKKGTYGDIQPTKFIHESFLIESDKDGNPDPRLDTTLFHPNSTENFIGEPYSWWETQFRNPEINTAYFKYSEQEFIGDVATEFDGGTDFIIIRYADVLLLYAEVLNQNNKTQEAYQYVDMVRERSNMLPLSVAKPGLDKDSFLEQIKHERVVELSGEVVRFFDLKRWGMYNSENVVRDPNFESFVEGRSEVQPIPQSELDLNPNLIQNPGY
ncbi:MAG: RagB/SusD family nutrient uptake outer membrane protein [Flavobacteriaceae bacterium]